MSKPRHDAPVVALDIDGTLGDYHSHFTRFIEAYTGRPMPDPAAMTGGVPFYKHLGVSKPLYRQAKLAYRQGGMKRSMPSYAWSGDITKWIRNQGAQVWICTTRPYLRLDNIDPDTRHWLRRNHVQYDGILYGERKYRDLVRAVGVERVLMVVDDLPEMCRQADGLGLSAYVRTQPYNTYFDSSGIAGRVGSVSDVMAAFTREKEKWQNNQ